MDDTSKVRMIARARYCTGGKSIDVGMRSGNAYVETWIDGGGTRDMYDSKWPTFPHINSSWEWVEIYPTATEEERVKIQLFRLLGADKWWEMTAKKQMEEMLQCAKP